jgi:hypothetical protein
MTADERIQSIRFKIKRAEKHLGDLFGALRAFKESRPYKVRAERDPQSRQPIYYIDSVEPLPVLIAAIIGDTIQNTRSAWDHLAWHLVEVGCAAQGITLTATERKQIGFPIIDTDSAANYEASRNRKVKGMRNDAINKIDALKPYKGGNDTLWQLNQLNNIDKHRFLLTAGLSLRAISAKSVLPQGIIRIFAGSDGRPTSEYISERNLLLIPKKPIFPLEKNTKLFVDVPDAEIDLEDDQKFRFDVAFSEPGIVEGKAVYPTLVEFINLVNATVPRFKDDLA